MLKDSAAACATFTASAVDITVSSERIAVPSAVRPARSSWNVVTSSDTTSRGTVTGCGDDASSRVTWAVTSSTSKSWSAIGRTVSKLNRRFSADDISLTPRSRRFAVAMTLNPRRARSRAPAGSVRVSSGTISCLSLISEMSTSWISGGQRVISSTRTRRPSLIARCTGEGTRARGVGPSASSSA